MVAGRLRGRTGKLPVGFLVTLAVVAAGVYYAIRPARGYVKYYMMKDEMRVQVRFASNQTDDDIRRRLRTKAGELGLPASAQRISIRRRGRPREITVTTSWPDTIFLPFYAIPITYRPAARAPL